MSYDSILSNRSVAQITILSICMTLLIGSLDHITGFELSFSIFYIIPITIASWYGGRKLGIFLSIFSAMTWFTADLLSGHLYSHKAIPVWNTFVRLGLFVIISLLLAKTKTTLKNEQEMAKTDGLTALLNGRAFRESVTKLLDFCRRIKRPLSMAYIDLDNFKQVNDTFGHTEGDRVLRVVGTSLLKTVRSTDIVGRLGGDEFAVALPDTNKEQARTVIEKMHLHLMKEVGLHNWPIGFSIGVISFAVPPITADDAIRHVDNLMYRVKKAGKNNIFFEEFSDIYLSESR